jgi:hypothetical protein
LNEGGLAGRCTGSRAARQSVGPESLWSSGGRAGRVSGMSSRGTWTPECARRWRWAAALGVTGVLLAGTANATKPCPAPPCEPDDAACWERHASWVAVGTITDVRRRPQGMPLMKDLADFVLRVKDWEKTHGERRPMQLAMRVGWCDSPKQLPVDTVGTFRFYGTSMAAASDGEGRVAVDYVGKRDFAVVKHAAQNPRSRAGFWQGRRCYDRDGRGRDPAVQDARFRVRLLNEAGSRD